MNNDLLTTNELCAAAGVSRSQVQHWTNLRIIVPAHDTPTARGYSEENVLEATQALELTKAGYTGRQLQNLFAVQRADVGRHRSAAARLIRRYEIYIDTIIVLAATFGKGDGYDQWLAKQRRQLEQMKAALASGGSTAQDHRGLLRMLVAAKAQRDTAATPLAG